MKRTLERIAKEHLHLDTLETRRCSDDFKEQPIWCIRAALEAAYKAGAARKKARAT
jgi:hypothetical protein